MTRIKVPSVLHLARIWRPTADGVRKQLIALAQSSPPFSYAQLLGMLRSMLAFPSDMREMESLIERSVKSELARKSYLSIAPLLGSYFSAIQPSFVHEVAGRTYSISRDLHVPFAAPMVFGAKGKVCLPVFIFWRHNPLSEVQYGLFASMLREIVSQDPDLDEGSTSILDFSAPRAGGDRRLHEILLGDLPYIAPSTRDEMLAVFVEGYELARAELQGGRDTGDAQHILPIDHGQHDLFR